ncbi:hypothetical protein GJ744_000188 [Endocarpon pusillum]|uniref:Uncharacterized protein n=1 Tax=Endocarpon pusillum TaxID=364733 RepID=A0A8H7AS83_9EURO|nr:hypothetical protein GJ744_000188 [Endocarpon pusillum]
MRESSKPIQPSTGTTQSTTKAQHTQAASETSDITPERTAELADIALSLLENKDTKSRISKCLHHPPAC